MSGKRIAVILPLLATISLLASEQGTRSLRRLATSCVRNVFATPDDIVANMPEVPTSTTDDIPAYIAMCQEWVRHDAYYQEEGESYEAQRVVEDVDVCKDWSAPHLSLLEMYAALTVSAHVPRIKYRHNCDRTKAYVEAETGFDYTTIQQVLNSPGLRSNDDVISIDDLKMQCKRCLLSFDGQTENSRIKSKAYHHCFAFPEDTEKVRDLNPENIPYVPYSYPGVAPFSSIIVAFRQRLYHAALEWQDVTDMPPNERDSGVVYWIDPTSIGLRYPDVMAEIPDGITTISILAGPLCATGILPTGENCHEYGEGLKDYLKAQYPALDATHGVTFKILTSTAAAFSRMILAQWLICPPRSNSCLFPSASKRINLNKAIVLEDPGWMKSVDFMAIAGHHGTTTTKILSADKIPPVTTFSPERKLQQAKDLTFVNAITDSEGYPQDANRPVIPSDSVINSLTPQQILDDISIAIERFKSNPNLYSIRAENVPNMDDIQKAIESGTPLYTNQVILWDNPRAFMPEYRDPLDDRYFRYAELSTDADSGRSASRPSIEYYNDASARRHDSMLRMQHDWATAIYGHVQLDRSMDDPSTVYEIKCPEGEQTDGSNVAYDTDGRVTTTNSEHVIVAAPDGITVYNKKSLEVVGDSLADIPVGTVFRDGDGFAVKTDETDAAAVNQRRVVQIQLNEKDNEFKAEVQKVCLRFKKRALVKKQSFFGTK